MLGLRLQHWACVLQHWPALGQNWVRAPKPGYAQTPRLTHVLREAGSFGFATKAILFRWFRLRCAGLRRIGAGRGLLGRGRRNRRRIRSLGRGRWSRCARDWSSRSQLERGFGGFILGPLGHARLLAGGGVGGLLLGFLGGVAS